MMNANDIISQIVDKRTEYFDKYGNNPNMVLLPTYYLDVLKAFSQYCEVFENNNVKTETILGMEIIETENAEIVCFRKKVKRNEQ